MTGDLGAQGGQVHEQAAAVLRFWFDEIPAEKRFANDSGVDAECARRFGPLHRRLVETEAAGWTSDARAILAAVIILDQFSRNMFRGSAKAFASDPLARRLADLAVDQGWDVKLTAEERQFLYMPFMHSESPADQDRAVGLFERLGDAESLKFARMHREVIDRFGRFPGRNAALGRPNTPEEAAYLAGPQAF